MAPVSAPGLLLLGVVSFQAVSVQAPAVNDTLQVEGITGDTRLSNRAAMYDAGAYLFQMGYGYVMADALSFAGIEAPDEVAPARVARERFEQAASLLADSLRRDPSNAYAWLFYAQSLASLGNVEDAASALEMSWHLGPTTHELASRRVFIADLIGNMSGATDAYDHIVTEDLAVLEVHAPRIYRSYVDQRD